MSKNRLLAAGAGVLFALALGTGLSAAQTTTAADPPSATASVQSGDHDAMHEQMRAQMPEAMQSQCEATHAGMRAGMAQHGGMGAGGMMGFTAKN